MTDEKKERFREFLLWTTALRDSMDSAVRGDPNNIWKYAGFGSFARKYNQILIAVAKEVPLSPILDCYDMDKMPSIGNTVHIQQKEIFEGVHANVSVLCAFLEGKIGIAEDEAKGFHDFIQARLRSAIFKTPENEYDVQDALELLMIGRGMQKGQEYDREVGRVKISSKEVIPDFVLLKLSLALEVKLIKSAARVKEVIDEINADIVSYSQRYRRLFFIVYDLGFIRDETEFRHDLERQTGVAVLVVKH